MCCGMESISAPAADRTTHSHLYYIQFQTPHIAMEGLDSLEWSLTLLPLGILYSINRQMRPSWGRSQWVGFILYASLYWLLKVQIQDRGQGMVRERDIVETPPWQHGVRGSGAGLTHTWRGQHRHSTIMSILQKIADIEAEVRKSAECCRLYLCAVPRVFPDAQWPSVYVAPCLGVTGSLPALRHQSLVDEILICLDTMLIKHRYPRP